MFHYIFAALVCVTKLRFEWFLDSRDQSLQNAQSLYDATIPVTSLFQLMGNVKHGTSRSTHHDQRIGTMGVLWEVDRHSLTSERIGT